MHSRDLRDADQVSGTRHAVVGIGNSGCDAAVELSRHGQVMGENDVQIIHIR